MDKRIDKINHFSFYILKWLIILLIGLFAAGLMTKPIRKRWSNNYYKKGNEYLAQKKYQSAVLEYRKALFLFWGNKDAGQNIELSRQASADVTALRDFYEKNKIDSQSALLQKVKQLPDNETEALKLTKEMIEDGEFQYAVIQAENGVEMDRNYRDAWLYLGIANLECAKSLELNKNQQQHYQEAARKALDKASSIDPEYQATKDYLAELGKIDK